MAWFRSAGRKLPWRSDPSPYRVLVSEFMLQQTTVTAVLPYFEKWMRDFPDVPALAAADEQQVLAHWQGLGYYSRARNLHAAARAIVAQHEGQVPGGLTELRNLPGVGPYTAAAVAAFAFDQCVPVLDANILRVVARLINDSQPLHTAAARQHMELAARKLLPRSGGRDHTSALMDLGATLCRAGAPDCSKCPVRRFCQAKSPEAIPAKKPRPLVVLERDLRSLALRKGLVFLIRSAGPRWKGLWVLPPAPPSHQKPVWESTHILTRHRIRLQVFRARPQPGWHPFPLDELPPMPTPHRQVMETLRKSPLGEELRGGDRGHSLPGAIPLDSRTRCPDEHRKPSNKQERKRQHEQHPPRQTNSSQNRGGFVGHGVTAGLPTSHTRQGRRTPK